MDLSTVRTDLTITKPAVTLAATIQAVFLVCITDTYFLYRKSRLYGHPGDTLLFLARRYSL